MPGRPEIRNRLASCAALLAGVLAGMLAGMLHGCVDGDVIEVDSHGATLSRCFSSMMYLVEGDSFTFLSGGQESIDFTGQGSSSAPTGSNPNLEKRAKCRAQFGASGGLAQLLWNDSVVRSVRLDETFIRNDDLKILAYQDPDGTEVEFHLYARQCASASSFPKSVSTRSEIEALEAL
jgi:hypothetical protein